MSGDRHAVPSLSDIRFRLTRWLIGRLVSPQVTGIGSEEAVHNPVYVLQNRSVTDIALLDLVCTLNQLPSPVTPIEIHGVTERRRFLFLHRPAGWLRRHTMATYSRTMQRLLAQPAPDSDVMLVPVNILWSRAPAREHSYWRLLVSEAWAVTGRFKRVLNVLMNREGIVVQFGKPLPLAQAADPSLPEGIRMRRMARLMRVRLRNQRIAALGPDLSHRRTLLDQIVASRPVQLAIDREAHGDTGRRQALGRRAVRMTRTIASDMSHVTIRILEKLLHWFWTRIYDGVELTGFENITRVAEDHTLVYIPSHRSHLDYLLLSYLLFRRGMTPPHIAAGDNLNIPVLGSILRRGGAFFMRRKFGDDEVYRTVFEEYLYQVYRRGHSVEYFPEGGRSRTGRLLPAKTGLLRMTIGDQARGLPRPIAFMPVYIAYEKLVEAATYLDELRGSSKQGESMFDVLRSLRLVRQKFGHVKVCIGEPLLLDHWLGTQPPSAEAVRAQALGNELMYRVNRTAHVNAVNLTALILLATPRLAIEASVLNEQAALYVSLLRFSGYDSVDWSGDDSIRQVARLRLVTIEDDVQDMFVTAESLTGILLTWYRNNVAHTLVLPSLVACLLVNRKRPLSGQNLASVVATIYPYLALELTLPPEVPATEPLLEHMQALGLVMRSDAGDWEPPPTDSASHQQLHLLAQVVMPSLERLFIVIGLLTRAEGGITRRTLQERSRLVARRLSRLYGLNAPEFFDATLFNQFVDQMLKRDALTEAADGFLQPSELAYQVARTAGSVISADFLRAVHRS